MSIQFPKGESENMEDEVIEDDGFSEFSDQDFFSKYRFLYQ